jgi:hypothetical protein
LRVVVFTVGVFVLDFDSSALGLVSSAGVEAGAGFVASDFDAEEAADFEPESPVAGLFPKADTVFPKTRNAERQVAERVETPFRAVC